jgi:hypothetical protein
VNRDRAYFSAMTIRKHLGLALAAATLLLVTDAQAQKNEGHSVLNRPTGGGQPSDSGPLDAPRPPAKVTLPPPPPPPIIGKPPAGTSSKSQPEKK